MANKNLKYRIYSSKPTIYDLHFSLGFMVEKHNIIGVYVTVDYLSFIGAECYLVYLILKDQKNSFRGYKALSCTPDREILHFTPCEKFLSHPRYLAPVAPCVQIFFFNTGCIGRHVMSSLSAHVTMTSKHFKSKWRTPRF